MRRVGVWEVLWVVDDGADLSSSASEHMDKEQQGQACIEYLHEQNTGRANFLVLEKIDETNGMRTIQTPGNVPRLFDLVEPKKLRFTHAFYKVSVRWAQVASRHSEHQPRWSIRPLALGQHIRPIRLRAP